jgi:hypothetical protein
VVRRVISTKDILLLLLLLWLHGPFSLALASLRIADHSFLSCALIRHLFTFTKFSMKRTSLKTSLSAWERRVRVSN